jgi:hypothetical protein
MIFPWQITCGKGPGKLTNETMETSRFKKLKISSHPLPPGLGNFENLMSQWYWR